MSLGTQSASRALLVAFLRANFKFSLCPGEAGCTRAGIAALDIRLARLALAWVGMQNLDQSTEYCTSGTCMIGESLFAFKIARSSANGAGTRRVDGTPRRNGDVDEIDFVMLSGVKMLPAHGAATIGLPETAG